VCGLQERKALQQTPSLDVPQKVAAGQPALYPPRCDWLCNTD